MTGIASLGVVAQLTLAVVLLVSGAVKARGPVRFAKQLDGYGFGGSITTPLALVVIAAELTAAILLLFADGPVAIAGFGLAAALLSGFFASSLAALAKGRKVECGCFGGDDLVGPKSVTRILLLVLLWAIAAGSRLASSFGSPFAIVRGGGADASEYGVAVAAALGCGLVVLAAVELDSAIGRRTFLRRAGGATVAFVLGLFGISQPALASCCYHYLCCDLCNPPSSCSNCACTWCWGCVYGNNTYECCECHSNTSDCGGDCVNVPCSYAKHTGYALPAGSM